MGQGTPEVWITYLSQNGFLILNHTCLNLKYIKKNFANSYWEHWIYFPIYAAIPGSN